MSIQNLKLDIQVVILAIQILFLITQMGCKQEIENPELADPIYTDLVAEMNSAKNEIAAELKSVTETREKIAALSPRDSSRGSLLRELSMHEKKLMIARQNRAYFEIRAEQRKKYDIEAYRKAFEKDLPWPNTDELTEYKKMKTMQSASRNWEDRVPKTTRYNRPQPGAETKETKETAKPAHGGEGGGH